MEEDNALQAARPGSETLDDWDREMLRDFGPGGRGAKFAEHVHREVADAIANGTARPMAEGFAARRNSGRGDLRD